MVALGSHVPLLLDGSVFSMNNISTVFEKKYSYPVKVLQFGQGNFLRAFADYFIDVANKNNIFCGSVVVAKSTGRGNAGKFKAQDYLYTVVERGNLNGKIVDNKTVVGSINNIYSCETQWDELVNIAKLDCLSVIISNTTEAGIAFDESNTLGSANNGTYPAKLTVLLYERYLAGQNNDLLILPVELIENNGSVLKQYVLKYARLWNLEKEFIDYINAKCHFCTTLVDRIVTGFPENAEEFYSKFGYEDRFLVTCEPYYSWIIEGDVNYKYLFPIDEIFSNVKWIDSVKPYRERKVKILNGTHTATVLSAYLCGFNIVRDMVRDSDYKKFINLLLSEEITKTIDLPLNELEEFSKSVLQRFDNPFIDHNLLDISLNSVSKFRARCLPSLLEYCEKFNEAPKYLCFSFASLISFYNGKFFDGKFFGERDGEKYQIIDDAEVLNTFSEAYKSDSTIRTILSNVKLWGADLATNNDVCSLINYYFNLIGAVGMRNALKQVIFDG